VHLSDFVLAPATAAMTAVAASDPFDLAATTQNDATIIATATTDDLSDKVVVTAATPDVSSDTVVGNSALFVDRNWQAQPTGIIGDSFDGTRDHIHGYAKYASFDEGGTPKTEDSIDDTVITLPSGRSVDLPHVSLTALTETSFAFDRAPVFDRSDAMAIGHD